MRRLEWGRIGSLRRSCPTHLAEALGIASGPIRGSAFKWLDETGDRAKLAWMTGPGSPCARKHGPGKQKTAAAERREALPWPLFPGDPGNKLRSLHYKVRLSALRLPSKRGEKD